MRNIVTLIVTQNVTATTCLSINHPLFSRRKFDYCIVDEASQSLLVSCVGPLLSTSKFILVGDPDQLPPVVQDGEARWAGFEGCWYRGDCLIGVCFIQSPRIGQKFVWTFGRSKCNLWTQSAVQDEQVCDKLVISIDCVYQLSFEFYYFTGWQVIMLSVMILLIINQLLNLIFIWLIDCCVRSEIMRMSNELIYEGRLVCGADSVADAKLHLPALSIQLKHVVRP